MFFEHEITKNLKSDWGDWKRVSYHGNQFFQSCRCVTCNTITLPSFNGLCQKLTETGLFTFLMLYWVQ